MSRNSAGFRRYIGRMGEQRSVIPGNPLGIAAQAERLVAMRRRQRTLDEGERKAIRLRDEEAAARYTLEASELRAWQRRNADAVLGRPESSPLTPHVILA